MSKQITVRLPDDIVDSSTDWSRMGGRPAEPRSSPEPWSGSVAGRRRPRYATILRRAGADPDLDSLAAFSARTPMDDLA